MPIRRSGPRWTRRRLRIAEAQKGRCHWCGVLMNGHAKGEKKDTRCTIDHVLPLSTGGSNGVENLVAACYKCNTTRNTLEIRKQGRDE